MRHKVKVGIENLFGGKKSRNVKCNFSHKNKVQFDTKVQFKGFSFICFTLLAGKYSLLKSTVTSYDVEKLKTKKRRTLQGNETKTKKKCALIYLFSYVKTRSSSIRSHAAQIIGKTYARTFVLYFWQSVCKPRQYHI